MWISQQKSHDDPIGDPMAVIPPPAMDDRSVIKYHVMGFKQH